MERLINVLDGDANCAVAAVGYSGLCYASALKPWKQDFGNPLLVKNKSSSRPAPNPTER